jgi:DedD protein
MAELVVTQDELALRRRARRRLVGAVAIALTVVVILPMLFDSEPKPLGPDVDIRMPAQDSPFETAPALAPPVQMPPSTEQPAPVPAEPTAVNGASPASALDKVDTTKAEATKAATAEKVKPEAKSEVNATTQAKTEAKPALKAEQKTEQKPKLKPDSTFATQGYFLQLGAFTNESNARQLHGKAVAAGFNVVMVSTNGQYRVRIGPLPQQERALEMQAKLKAKGFSPVLLGP